MRRRIAGLQYEMSDAEVAEFLDIRPRYAVVTTFSHNGYPMSTPLSFSWDGAAFSFAVAEGRPLLRRVQRDPRVAVCVSTDRYPQKYVAVQGDAEVCADPGGVLSAAVVGRDSANTQPPAWVDDGIIKRHDVTVGRRIVRVRPAVRRTFNREKLLSQTGGDLRLAELSPGDINRARRLEVANQRSALATPD
jgi:nitroimidazol reductase NimA-like FMN-containing flavoprotein (pyridoxamine 5'-phosphate oxidase superfamily)